MNLRAKIRKKEQIRKESSIFFSLLSESTSRSTSIPLPKGGEWIVLHREENKWPGYENKWPSYEIISMRYEIISMRYWNKSALYENKVPTYWCKMLRARVCAHALR